MKIHIPYVKLCTLPPSSVDIPVHQRNEVETDEGAEGHASDKRQRHRPLQLVPQP